VTDQQDRLHRIAVRLAAVAQSGLTYTQSPFEIDRFTEVRTLAAELLAEVSDQPYDDIAYALTLTTGYATPKIDVRGAVFDADERVLLTQERNDGKWSLPGGWLDAGMRPSDGIRKEIREETGYAGNARKLVGAWERATRGHHPAFPGGIVKLFFLCEVTGEPEPHHELETLGTDWFHVDRLPELSPGRINEHEIRRCLEHHRDPSLPTEFD
jgi:ADP-ribose pyrophosphatase YjhB (NUDIX family)